MPKITELTATEVARNVSKLRENLKKGPVRIIWRESKPGGEIVFSATVKRDA